MAATIEALREALRAAQQKEGACQSKEAPEVADLRAEVEVLRQRSETQPAGGERAAPQALLDAAHREGGEGPAGRDRGAQVHGEPPAEQLRCVIVGLRQLPRRAHDGLAAEAEQRRPGLQQGVGEEAGDPPQQRAADLGGCGVEQKGLDLADGGGGGGGER